MRKSVDRGKPREMDKHMADSTENLETVDDDDEGIARAMWLHDFGHFSGTSTEAELAKYGNIVEVVGPWYVSKPCWETLLETAKQVNIMERDLAVATFPPEDSALEEVHQFVFETAEITKQMALMVQRSACNIRKNATRRARMQKAGGFHNREALNKLFEIQEGKCYYSGDSLVKDPKNFTTDHIVPIWAGGSDWPENLALVLKEINSWKGGNTAAETFLRLKKERGAPWLRRQRTFCAEVDRKRKAFDIGFRAMHSDGISI